METGQFQDLLERLREGDSEAGQEVALQLSPLVSALAGRFARNPAENEDYYQVGMIGLLKAAHRFNPAARVKFTTYAFNWIKGEMLTYRRGNHSPVKVSRSLWEQARSLNTWREKLAQKFKREPVISELAGAMGTTVEEIALIMDATLPLTGLEEESLCAREGFSEEEELVDRLSLQDGMLKLAPLERRLIMLRFYREMTQEETGRALNISQRQVSRLEKRTLRQLRQYLQH